jgi:hypothetical protein
MDRLGFILFAFLFVQCGSDYEPTFSGKTISHDWNSDKLRFNIDGQQKVIKLPTNNDIDFNNPIWLRAQDLVLIKMTERSEDCNNYSVVTFDLNGHLLDTVYKAAPCTFIEFMPSPNDKLLLLRVHEYADRYTKPKKGRIKYLIYDITKQLIQDSLTFDNSNLELDKIRETVWSPDSQNVLVLSRVDNKGQFAFIYDIKGGKKLLDSGTNFVWSPTDNNLVSYIKDNKIVFKNLNTNETTNFYSGQEGKRINDFRWNPTGEFLVINFNGHFFNIDSESTWRPTSVLVSVPDQKESKVFERHNGFDSWK